MKKICMLTSEESFLTNFGAALQGYALYKTLSEFNYQVNIQRYLGGTLKLPNKKISILKRICNYSIIEIYLKVLFRLGKLMNKQNIIKQRELFQNFQDDLMSFYPGTRKIWGNLKDNYPKADIYICGSDQIWNPMFKNGYNDPGYFLNFVKNNKISYAPSFGVSDIPESAQTNLKELLDSFDYISVRENEGAKIIKKYTEKNAKVVLDPTLLIEAKEWNKIARVPKNLPSDYILCYRFGNSIETNSKIKDIGKMLNLPIIELPLSGISYYNFTGNRIFEAGPREFIGLIKNASFVCTDSFHATVFSIILEVPFVTFLRDENIKKSEGMNSRVLNLLTKLKLKSRIAQNLDLNNQNQLFNIDFDEAKKILESEKKESLQWLKNALEGVEKKNGWRKESTRKRTYQ